MAKVTFRDVAHHYVGCEIIYQNKKWELIGTRYGALYIYDPESTDEDERELQIDPSFCLPLLIPMFKMNDQQAAELNNTMTREQQGTKMFTVGVKVWTAQSFAWACKNHFNVFGLEETEFIDKTTYRP